MDTGRLDQIRDELVAQDKVLQDQVRSATTVTAQEEARLEVARQIREIKNQIAVTDGQELNLLRSMLGSWESLGRNIDRFFGKAEDVKQSLATTDQIMAQMAARRSIDSALDGAGKALDTRKAEFALRQATDARNPDLDTILPRQSAAAEARAAENAAKIQTEFDSVLAKNLEAALAFKDTDLEQAANQDAIRAAFAARKVMTDSLAQEEIERAAADAQEITSIREANTERVRGVEIQRESNALAELKQQIEAVRGNTTLTPAQRAAEILPLLEQERQALLANIAAWTAYNAANAGSADPQVQGNIGENQGRILDARGRVGEIGNEQAAFQGQLQPIRGEWEQFVTGLGDASANAATALTSTLGTAINGISSGITGLIMGTQTWGQAAMQSIGAIIQELVQLGIRTMMYYTLRNTLMGASLATALGIRAADTASHVAAETTKAAATAPSAILASISSYGAAALIGAAAFAGAMALAGGFAEGGLIPGAPSSSDNRIAHVATGEYVVRSAAVQKYGAGTFDALNEMRVPSRSGGGLIPSESLAQVAPVGQAGSGGRTKVVVVDDKRAARREMYRDPEFSSAVVNAVNGSRAEVGMRG
jgi:hypothetical protein